MEWEERRRIRDSNAMRDMQCTRAGGWRVRGESGGYRGLEKGRDEEKDTLPPPR